jgi:hypothetical protein
MVAGANSDKPIFDVILLRLLSRKLDRTANEDDRATGEQTGQQSAIDRAHGTCLPEAS